MHGHSGSIGSFTLTTISALAHTSAALGTSVPPATRYASSANPEPIPAPCSTSTLCPSPTSDSTPAGTNAIRCSAVLISFGTPTIIAAPSSSARRRARSSRVNSRLAVDRKTGQTIHPGGRTLQGQHQLPLRLLFRLGKRLSAEPGAGELGVLLADRRRGLGCGLGLRADVHPRDTHLPVEARERVDRVGQPQLFPNALEQAARHPAAEHVRQHQQRVLAPVGVR